MKLHTIKLKTTWVAAKNKLSVSVAVPPVHVRVPSQRPLAPSVASVRSVANDKGDNEMILGAAHRSPGICLKAEENNESGGSFSQNLTVF